MGKWRKESRSLGVEKQGIEKGRAPVFFLTVSLLLPTVAPIEILR